MAIYKTPGVYVEELSNLPQSVADVPTAIAGFVGYTEKASKANTPIRITSLMEYESIFGAGPDPDDFDPKTRFVTYDSIRLFYDNGGGVCYVVSIGKYKRDIKSDDFINGLKALEKIDEVTLLVAPDAASTLGEDDLAKVQQAMLKQCAELRDRFAILDVKYQPEKDIQDTIKNFREKIGTTGLAYGAAYYPYVSTSYNYLFSFETIVKKMFEEYYKKEEDKEKLFKEILKDDAKSIAIIKSALKVTKNNDGATQEPAQEGEQPQPQNSVSEDEEKALKDSLKNYLPYYAETEAECVAKMSIVPPSGAIAGIYAQTDNFSGVWQAPANVGIASVKDLTCLINNQAQEDMNDTPTGKSVNAIRFFSGKGILVWGARTLKANDLEWRYIPVRRLFNYVEESVQESTEWAIFSPNTQNTWTKVKSQIENFLYNIWRAGGLAGATPAEAYYVNVGLGITMDSTDILNGRMIVEIGMAAIRPAEFIVLRFSHKVQES